MSSAETKTENAETPVKKYGFGYRHTQYLLMFAACTTAYGMRAVINVAIIAMLSADSKGKDYPTYPEWTDKKNIMLSAFFWGYICLQLVAGQVAKKYGPKLFLCGAIFVTSVATILTPILAAQVGYGGVILCRILQGLSQGFLVPSIHHLLSQWAPTPERATWGSAVYAGQALGNVFSMPITGVICKSKYGWPMAFYLYGCLGSAWCILWLIFGSDGPSKHKNISKEEKAYVEASIEEDEEDRSEIPTPWRSIFTSMPVITLILTHWGQNWGYWTLLTEIPSFMEKILKEDIASNSLLSALPYFVMWFMTLVFSPIADLLIDRKIVSLITSRKIFNTIGLGFPAICLICLCFVSNKIGSIAILVTAIGFNAAQLSGFNINHIDLSPVHAGTLMAITNSSATIMSILAPLAVDLFRVVSGYEETDKQLWNIVFCVAAGFYIFSTMMFNIFASGDIQSWNYSDSKAAAMVDKDKQKAKIRALRKISTISVA